MKGYEVEHEFPGIGQRTMRLNARQVFYKGGSHATILLGIEDVTDRRILEREKDDLLREKENFCEKRMCYSRNCSTAFPIACKSSLASF